MKLWPWKNPFARARELPTYAVSDLRNAPPTRVATNDGEKFPGGYGVTELLIPDYWTLRARSSQLFETNLYARGIIRRLITNEINTGLHLEATPEEELLGLNEDDLAPWTESTENKFRLWGKDPRLCDHTERSSFGGLQVSARMEALAAGDVLCMLRQDVRTGLPRVHLISGSAVRTPLGNHTRLKLAPGNTILHGVELDESGRHVAYWMQKKKNNSVFTFESERLPAFGPDTGRRVAWLLYGTDKRLDDVRGKPFLSLMLQSVREIDRYRDSAQRKAVINSMLAMYISKGEDKQGTKPMTRSAARVGNDPTTDSENNDRTYRSAEMIPGLVLDELQHGEEPKGFMPHGTDEKFGEFEEAIIQTVAWANEIPPEILRLSFSSNYSASQAATNEFLMYLNKVRTAFGEDFCTPVYVDWLLSAVLTQKVDAPGFLDAWRDFAQYETFGAWTSADWSGHIKPAIDMLKLSKAYELMIFMGMITRDRASRELTGQKFSKNVQKLERENLRLAEANAPMAAMQAPADLPEEEEEDADPNREDEEEERGAA